MLNPNTTLIFVYNADSTLFAAATDFVKKYVAPDKYECNLCMVTYGVVNIKSKWEEYLGTLSNKKRFLHRDEFLKEFPSYSDAKLPIIFTLTENRLEILVSADEINKVKDVSGMVNLLKSKI